MEQKVLKLSEMFTPVQKKLKTAFSSLINAFKCYGNKITIGENIDFSELTYFENDADYTFIKKAMLSNTDNFKELNIQSSRAIATFICSAIGDAIGTHVEFSDIEYNRKEKYYPIKDLTSNFKVNQISDRCYLGEFSDDTCMALCLADSLVATNYAFLGRDQMMKYLLWWHCSYNNCLQLEKGQRRHSFGLGGNIHNSFQSFINVAKAISLAFEIEKLPEESDADPNANGNGSIMRLAPIPVAFASDAKLFEVGLDFAARQSKVTHTGIEAAESCRLLCHLIMKNIQRDPEKEISIQEWMDSALADFQSSDYSVQCIQNSIDESEKFAERYEKGDYNPKFTKKVEDRNWNWKDPKFRYSPTREDLMPGYIGSYCLDALAMALHISYYCSSPSKAILKAGNLGGDCDSVAAVVGQIVGSFYGLDNELLLLYDGVKQYDQHKCAYLGYKLFNEVK